LRAALCAALADDGVAAIVPTGGLHLFSAGADIRDFEGAPERLDQLRGLFDAVEQSAKPVIAAINGLCMGAGWNLRWRVTGALRGRGPDSVFPKSPWACCRAAVEPNGCRV
jgi:3-hydroxyacyl-CoA dehydrogenase